MARSLELKEPIIYVSINYRSVFFMHFVKRAPLMPTFLVFLVCLLVSCRFSRDPNIALTAFGFLPGKEVKKGKIGNLGLDDRKLIALRFEPFVHASSRTRRFEMGAEIHLNLRR